MRKYFRDDQTLRDEDDTDDPWHGGLRDDAGSDGELAQQMDDAIDAIDVPNACDSSPVDGDDRSSSGDDYEFYPPLQDSSESDGVFDDEVTLTHSSPRSAPRYSAWAHGPGYHHFPANPGVIDTTLSRRSLAPPRHKT